MSVVKPETQVATPVSGAFQTYAAALLPFAVLVIGGFQVVLDNPGNWSVIVAFGLLVLGNVATYAVRVLPTGWHGALKTGVAILFAVLSALAPFVLPGGFDPDANTTLIVVAVLNALSVELGVKVRTGPIDAGTAVEGVAADISSLPAASPVTLSEADRKIITDNTSGRGDV